MLKFFNIATDKDDPDSFQGGGKSESAKKPRNTSQASPKNKPQQTFPLREKQIKRFYAIVRNSGAGDEVTKLVVEKVAPQVMRDGRSLMLTKHL